MIFHDFSDNIPMSYFKEACKMRVQFTLRCEECKDENYILTKNKTNQPERVEVKKYCKKCDKHTMHKEKKK